MTRALIYARISKEDPTVEATADQERRCRELAAREGYDVAGVFADDGISAFSGKDRPAWRRLHESILSDQGDIVLAVDMDRFSRDTIELLTFAVHCREHAVRWHTANGSRVDPSRPDDFLQITIKGGVAHNESAVKSERVKASVVRRRLAGRDIGGPRPFGFTDDRRSLVEAEAELVREGHRLVLAGASTYAVTKVFMNSNVPPVRAEAWSYVIVRKILTRPRNAALAVTDDGTVYELTEHPAIVSRADHEAVTAVLTSSTSQSIGRKPQHLASGGVARCGTCGGALRYSGQRKSYRCVAGNGGLAMPDGQTHASINAAELDGQMTASVLPALLRRLGREDDAEPDSNTRVLLARRADLEKRRAQATELALLPGADMARVKRELAEVKVALDGIEAELIEARSAGLSGAAIREIARDLLGADRHHDDGGAAIGIDAARASALFGRSWASMTLEAQRGLVRSLLNVRVNPAGTSRQTRLVTTDGVVKVEVLREGPKRVQITRR